MKPRHAWLLVPAVLCLGCGGDTKKKAAAPAMQSENRDARQRKPAENAGQDGEPARADRGEDAPVTRKIIYTADLAVIVEDLPAAEAALREQARRCEGYVAQWAVTGSAGTPRHGSWRVRVPVERLDEFVAATLAQGVPERNTMDSQDVTKRYYDLEARVKTYTAAEERLRDLLTQATGKVEDLIKVEDALAERRAKIEEAETELRGLKDLTALTTVNVAFREIKDYVPPQAPSFTNSVSRTFSDSLGALVSFGKGVALFLVALVPWLPLIAVVVIPLWVFARRCLRPVRSA